MGYKAQIRLGLGIFIVSIIIAHILNCGIIHNLGWIIYGAMFAFNPVWPERWNYMGEKNLKKWVRISGIICIVIGLITRFNY